MKTSKVADIFWLKKSRGSKKRVRQRGSESATAMEKSRSLAVSLSRTGALRF